MYVKTPYLHIRVLWGVEYVMPSFMQPTPEDGKVLALTRDVSQGQPPNTVNFNPNWLKVDAEDVLSLEEITQDLTRTAPGTPSIHKQKINSDRIVDPRTSIYPLKLICLLLRSPFMSPTRAWHLQSTRASTLHLDQQVHQFLKGIWRRTKSPTKRINTLTRVNLADATLQACQELLKALVPPPNKNLQRIMASVQALVFTVNSLQLQSIGALQPQWTAFQATAPPLRKQRP